MIDPSPVAGTHVLPPKVEELRLIEVALEQIEAAADSKPFQVAGYSTGRGQALSAIAHRFPEAAVDLWYLDLHLCDLAMEHAREQTGGLPSNLVIR